MDDSTNHGTMLGIYALDANHRPDQVMTGGDLRYPRDQRLALSVVAGDGGDSVRLTAQLERRDDASTRWVYYKRSNGEVGRMRRYEWNAYARRLTPTEMAYQIDLHCRGIHRVALRIEAA